ILTLNYFQHLLHIHWNGFLLFIPWVSNALQIKWQMRNRSGFHRVGLPGISFINIHSQSRLEGNNNPYPLFPSRTERPLLQLIN
ncbi:hypothetical protein, partial [Dorea longicatena]|uniref:hypothetical protein n=2 Tax=Dorea longicatena TaxID=88431 RepID=UPI00321A43C5